MRVARLASSAITGALWGALVPIVALLALEPAEYGSFSTIYLFFAYGVSLQYSFVSEAWARARGRYRSATARADYSTALFALAAVVSIFAFGVAMFLPRVDAVAGWLAASVLFGVYRNGSRYYWLAQGIVRRVILSDLLGIIAFAGVFLPQLNLERMDRLAIAWAASTVVGAVGLGLPALRRGSGPSRWWRTHKNDIVPLLSDSTLMDAGAIGAPFLLVGFMGPQNFGLYRGIANAAMPVRLLLDPIRPAVGRRSREFFFRKAVLCLVGATTILIAAACYVALQLIVPAIPYRLGTLSEMVVFAAPSALFAAASFVGTLYYIVCRTNAGRRTIMRGRIWQTALVFCMPVAGFATFGLEGAIWGFAGSAAVSSIIWMFLAAPRNRSRIAFADTKLIRRRRALCDSRMHVDK